MTPQYSIIVPVCNAAPWLHRCLDSILAQSVQDWEAVCINRGSLDDSGIILDSYAERDKRIIVIHEGSISDNAARNVALEVARGVRIWMITANSVLNNQALKFLDSIFMCFPTAQSVCVRDACLIGAREPIKWPDLHAGQNIRSTHERDSLSIGSFLSDSSVKIMINKHIGDLRFEEGLCLDERVFYSTYFWSIQEWILSQGFLLYVSTMRQQSQCEKDELVALITIEHRLLQQLLQNRIMWSHAKMQLYLNQTLKRLLSLFYEKILQLDFNDRKAVVGFWSKTATLCMSAGGRVRGDYIVTLLRHSPFLCSGKTMPLILRSLEIVRVAGLWRYLEITTAKLQRTLFPKKMRLGVSYNLFDGEELLLASIKSIRANVDYICVVYQDISNSGIARNVSLSSYLERLKEVGLINEAIRYSPNINEGRHENEKIKRRLGMLACKKNRCTHFLDMDVDEFYRAGEFAQAKKFIEKNNIEVSAVSIIEYVKKPIYRLVSNYMFPPGSETYVFYVPFICKITSRRQSGLFPCLVDPTRGFFRDGKFFLFSKQDIAMHHMSTVRKDLYLKFQSSTLACHTDFQEVYNIIEDFEFCDDSRTCRGYDFIGNHLVKKVDNEFKIEL